MTRLDKDVLAVLRDKRHVTIPEIQQAVRYRRFVRRWRNPFNWFKQRLSLQGTPMPSAHDVHQSIRSLKKGHPNLHRSGKGSSTQAIALNGQGLLPAA